VSLEDQSVSYEALDLETPAGQMRGLYQTLLLYYYKNNNIYNIYNVYSPTDLQRLVRIALHPNKGRVFKYIMEHEAFTIAHLKKFLKVPNATAYALIEELEILGYIRRVAKIQTGSAPANIYLIAGGDKRRVKEAETLYRDIKPTVKPPPFEYSSGKMWRGSS